MSVPGGISAIERYLPTYDVRSSHRIEVLAPGPVAYRATRSLDVGRSVPVMVLFAIRGLPHLITGKVRATRSITLDSLLDAGFVILEESPPKEFVMGAVGRFWRPDSGLVRIDPSRFTTLETPGLAKAALTFRVDALDEATAMVTTATRVLCTDPSARRKFLLYWRAIGPFSGFIRKLMLDQVKRTAEATDFTLAT